MATIPIYYGFNVNDNVAIDSRYSYANETQRLGLLTSQAYEGLITYQIDTNEVWVLTDAANPGLAASWIQVGNVEFSDTESGKVYTWAEGGNTDLIPSNKLPSQANFSDVSSYLTKDDRDADTTTLWHQGDVALVTADPVVANDGLYFYTGTDQLVAGITNDDDFTKLNIAGTDLTQTVDATSYTIESSTGANLLLSTATDATPGIMSAADKAKLDGSEFIVLTALEQVVPVGYVAINGLNEDFWVNISSQPFFVTTAGYSAIEGGTKLAFDVDNSLWRRITDAGSDYILLSEADTDYLVKDGQVAVQDIDEMYINRSGSDITIQRGHDFGNDDFNDNTTWVRLAGERLPTQSDATNGQYLQSLGTDNSEVWADVSEVPTPAADSTDDNKILTVDGTNYGWETFIALPDQEAADNGQFLRTDGDAADWAPVFPPQGDGDPNTENLFLQSTGEAGSEVWASAMGSGVEAMEIPLVDPTSLTPPGVAVNVGGREFAYISDTEWYLNNQDATIPNVYQTGDKHTDFTKGPWIRLGADLPAAPDFGTAATSAVSLGVSTQTTTINGTVNVTGDTTFEEDITVDVNAEIKGALKVDGKISTDDNPKFNTISVVDQVWTATDTEGNGNWGAGIDLTKATDFGTDTAGNVTLGTTAHATTINGTTVTTSGALSVGGTLGVTGLSTLAATNTGLLGVTGNITGSGSLSLPGTGTDEGDISIAGLMTIGETLSVTGKITTNANPQINTGGDVNGYVWTASDNDGNGSWVEPVGSLLVGGTAVTALRGTGNASVTVDVVDGANVATVTSVDTVVEFSDTTITEIKEGSNIGITLEGNAATINSTIAVQNDTTDLVEGGITLRFTGDGVTASNLDVDNPGIKVINIPGGGDGGSFTTRVRPATPTDGTVSVAMGEVLYISSTEWYVNINDGISPNPANPIVVNSAYDPSAAANSALWRPYAASATGFTFITPIATDRAVETDQFVYINEDNWYLRTGEATTVNLDTVYGTGWRRLGGTGVVFLQQEGVPVGEDGSTTINFRGGDAIQVVEEGDGVGVITVNAVPSTQRELLSFTWPNTALRSNINGVLGGYTMVLGAAGLDFDADTWSLTISETGEPDVNLSWDTTTSNLGQADFVRHLADTLVAEYPQYSWDDIVHESVAADLEAIDVTNPFNTDGGFDLDNGTYRNEWEDQVGREVLYITISGWNPGTTRFLGFSESSDLSASGTPIIGWRPANGFDNSSFSLHLGLPATGFNAIGSTPENFIKGIYEVIATNDSDSYDPSVSFTDRLADFYAIEGAFPGATNSTNNAGTDPNAYTIALPWVANDGALFSGFGITQIPILGTTDYTNVDVTFSWKINPYVEATKIQSTAINNGQLLSIVTPASSIFNGYTPSGFQGSSFVNVNIGNTYDVAPTVGDLLPSIQDANQFFYADVEAAVPVTTKTIVQQTDAEGNNLYNTTDIDGDSNNRPRYSVLANNDENYIEILEDIKDKWDALDDYSAFRDGRTINVRKDTAESFDTTGFSVTIDNQDALIDVAYLGNILTDGTDGDRVVDFEGYTAPVIANPTNSEDSGIDIKTIEIFGIQYGIASDGALVDLPNTFEDTNTFKSDVIFEDNNDNGSDWDALEIYKNREETDADGVTTSQPGEDNDYLGSIRWQSNNNVDAPNAVKNPNSSANISVRDITAGTSTTNPNVRLEMDVRNTGSNPTKLRLEGGNALESEYSKLWFGDEGGGLNAVIALNRKFDLDESDIAAEYLGSRLENGLVSSFSYSGASLLPKIHGEWWHRPVVNSSMGEITFRGKKTAIDAEITDFAKIEVIATETDQATSRIELAPYTQGTKTTALTVAHDKVTSNVNIEVNQVNPLVDLKTTSGDDFGQIKFGNAATTYSQIDSYTTDTTPAHIFDGFGRTSFKVYNAVSTNLEEVLNLKAASVVFGTDTTTGRWADIDSSSATFSRNGEGGHVLTQTAVVTNLIDGSFVATKDIESNYRETDADETPHPNNTIKAAYERFQYREINDTDNYFLRKSVRHDVRSRITGARVGDDEEVIYETDPFRLSMGKPIRMYNLPDDPSILTSQDGDIYYRDSDGNEGLRVFDNGAWSDIGSGDGGGGGINIYNGVINSFIVTNAADTIDFTVQQTVLGAGVTDGNISVSMTIQRVNRTADVWVAERASISPVTNTDSTVAEANTAFALYDSLTELEALTWVTI